jgi:hypothetical protein
MDILIIIICLIASLLSIVLSCCGLYIKTDDEPPRKADKKRMRQYIKKKEFGNKVMWLGIKGFFTTLLAAVVIALF